MTTPFELNPRAATGFSKAAEYDANRPSYAPEIVRALLERLGVADEKNARIIDLASGTGKFTELLAKREEQFEIIAVEPHEGMKKELEAKNLGSQADQEGGRVKVLGGHAADMGIDEGWGDALIAAQAFHWFANEESLKEIHRVLKPGATFGLIWNIEDYNAPKDWPAASPWEQSLKDIIAGLTDGTSRFRDMAWKQVFEKQLNTTPLQTLKNTFTQQMPQFSLPLGEETVKWTVWLPDEKVWARYATLSQIAVLEGEQLEAVKKQVLEALKAEGTERNEKGEVGVHGVTYFAWTSRV